MTARTQNSDNFALCTADCPHPDLIDNTRAQSMPDVDAGRLAELFHLLGDTNRVRILEALTLNELCVCDLAALLNVNQSALSHQLRLLRSAHLVRFRREGKNAFYTLDDNHVAVLFRQALEHVRFCKHS